ncbi:MAG TPA: hypothetical protein VF302_06500 [Candidatus Limnocylindrales bacterium]|jgi:hypothetical protein
MAERAAHVGAPGATPWASLPIPDLPDPAAGRRATAELDAAVRYLHSAHRLGRHCERTDHIAEIRREAEREVEAQADAMAALIRTVLRSLDLSDEIELRGLEVATEELRKLAERYDE